MADTGDGPRGASGAGWSAGLLGRLVRVVTHPVPAGGPATGERRPVGRPTVGLVTCHLVRGGYGDQVVDRVEQALHRRGHLAGGLDAVGDRAPVVVVAHAGPRARPVLPAAGVDAAVLAGRPVALVAYGPVPVSDPRPLDEVRTALSGAGARVTEGTVLFDTARLHRPAATCHPGAPVADPFDRLVLELVLDDLLAGGPTPAPVRPRRTR